MDAVGGHLSWPLVGRRRQLEEIVDALDRDGARGALVNGPAGVGKTRLADECLAAAIESGRDGGRVTATTGGASVPLGALAPLLPAEVLQAGADIAALYADVAAALRDRTDGAPFVLFVDDLHLLDATSMTLLGQLLDGDVVFLLATVRAGTPPPGLVDLARRADLVRVDIGDLSRDEVDALLHLVLEGPVDAATTEDVWRVSQGNVLFVRELVTGARASGQLVERHGVWRLAGPLTSTPRLVELVESRVAALSAQERGALELLAVCGALGLDELVGVTGSEPVEALDRAGLLAIVQDRRRHEVGVAHPLHGEVLREQLPALRRRRLLLDHADRVEHLGARRREDALRIANARLEGAGTADAGLLVGAARLARYGHDHRQVVRLAQAAMDESPTPEAALLLGEALHEMGRYEEAEAVLARHADVDADIDEHVLVPLVAMRVRNHFWGLQRPDDALALNRAARARFASPARDELAADEAMLLVFTDHARDALEAAQSIPLDAEPRIRVLRGIAEVPALIFSGRCETALPLTMERYADHVRLGDQVAIAHPAVQLIYRMRAFMEAGNLDAAREIATAGHQTVSDVVPADRVWFTLGLGWIDVLAGHPVSARRWLTEAAAMCRGAALAGQLRVVLSMLAVAEAYAGDAAAASAAVAEQQDLGPFAYMRGEQELGPAWATAAAGDTRGARELLTAAADEAEVDGRLAVEAWLRHDVARLGDAPAVAARLEELAKVCEGAFVPAYALDARGAADHDPVLLAGARDRFEAIGADLLAAEAAATAALAYRRHGDQRAAAGMATRANVSKDRCEGGHTPALVVPVAVVPLTAREREVALLAANGMSSREIAERLVVSVRTVDNHLQSTYTKLGISGRGELADALGATSG